MPLYEYECEGCGRRFEVIRKFADPPVDVCEVCGGKVRKLLSSPAIQFKGSGWYVTDYARKGGGGGTGSSDSKSSSDSPASSPAPDKGGTGASDKSAKDQGGKDKT